MRRLLTVAVTALGCGLAIAACGSSSPAKHSSPRNAFLAFSQCMRSHGLTNFPDPSAQGGIQLSSSSGLNPFSPAFKAAQGQCRHFLPGGGPAGDGHPSAQALKQMVQISECMRAHGVTGFPDPTTNPPTSPPSGGIAEGRGGVFLIVPSTIDVNSPAFKSASSACAFGPGGGAKATTAP